MSQGAHWRWHRFHATVPCELHHCHGISNNHIKCSHIIMCKAMDPAYIQLPACTIVMKMVWLLVCRLMVQLESTCHWLSCCSAYGHRPAAKSASSPSIHRSAGASCASWESVKIRSSQLGQYCFLMSATVIGLGMLFEKTESHQSLVPSSRAIANVEAVTAITRWALVPACLVCMLTWVAVSS